MSLRERPDGVERSGSNSGSSASSKASRGSWGSVTKRPEIDGHNDDDTTKINNERGPLLDRRSVSSATDRSSSVYSADPLADHEVTKSTGWLVLLTTCMLGLQIAWSIEMASVSPFLLSLGLSKSLLALVWIAGPLSGTLVQPYVGIRSDNSRHPYGRRRPFMIGGTIATMICLLALSWTREIVSGFVGVFGVAVPPSGTSPAYQVFAVVLIYVLDFAINVIQAAVRAFIVDCAPTHQQELANAWASRVSGVGHIATYYIGFINLPEYFPWLGDTQFKVFVALGCVVMAVTMAISCLSVQERDPRSLGDPPNADAGAIAFFKAMYRSIRNLPPQVRKVCLVQLFAWIGWFPFLFYTTTYIGGLYAEPYFKDDPHRSEDDINDIWEQGTRVGTLALLVFAVATFLSSVFLPMIIPPTYEAPLTETDNRTRATPLTPRTPNTPGSAHLTDYFDSTRLKKVTSKSRLRRLQRLLDPAHLRITSLTLRRAWLLSHILFFILTWLTLFVRTASSGIVLIGLIGVPWALTNWAPFALIAAEISRRDAAKRGLRIPGVIVTAPSRTSSGAGQLSRTSSTAALEASLHTPSRPTSSHILNSEEETTDQAGVLLGIHNVAIAAPQVIATLVSSAMFHVLQKERGTPGDDSVGWVLRFGGVCALAAAWAARGVEENGRL